VRGEGRGTDRGDTGKGSQDLAFSLGEQRHDFDVDGIEICPEPAIPVQVTTQPMST
jgi:hypothetical protein